MRRLTAFPSGFPGGSCGTKHRGDFYDEKDMPEIGAFAAGAGSVFCGVCLGTSHRQFSMEQQRHLWRLSGVYFVDGSASLGAYMVRFERET